MNFISRCRNKVRQVFKTIKTNVLRPLGFGDMVPKAVWEEQFSTGFWDYLGSEEEAGHYHTIVKFYNQFYSKGTLLDLGCGKGVLFYYLKQSSELSYPDYTGVDISENAVKSASQQFPGVSFVAMDLNHITINQKFDVIVFNESLYYCVRYLETLKKCTIENLAPGGGFIISMFDEPKNDVIWKHVLKQYNILAEETAENSKGQKWNVKLLRPIKA